MQLHTVCSLAPVFLLAASASDLRAQACDSAAPPRTLVVPPGPFSHFGVSLAAAEDLIAVGDTKFPSAQPGQGTGAVVLYRRDGASWRFDSILTAPADSARKRRTLQFGYSVALAGDTLAVGALGQAWIFRRESGSPAWKVHAHFEGTRNSYSYQVAASDSRIAISYYDYTQIFERAPTPEGDWVSVAEIGDGALGNGESLSIAGDLLVFGRGLSARVYRCSSRAWTLESSLRFAVCCPTLVVLSVSTDGERVAIGSGGFPPIVQAGFVDVFRRSVSGAGWIREAHLSSPVDGANQPAISFGHSVAIGGDRLFVGDPGQDSDGQNAGVAYTYRRLNGEWSPIASLRAPEPASDGTFGWQGVLLANQLVVGGSGLYATTGPTLVPFCKSAGAETPHCAAGVVGLFRFVADFLRGDPSSDYNNDARISMDDLFAFLADWFAGCPR